MKKYHLLLSFAFLLLLVSCKKKDSEAKDNPTPISLDCYLSKYYINDAKEYNCYYDSQNRLIKISSYSEGKGDSSYVFYTHSGNLITKTSKNGIKDLVETYYLNSNGFADSLVSVFDSLNSYTYYWKYNEANQAIELKVIGGVAQNMVDIIERNEYTNGNKTRQTSINNETATTVILDFEYYLDKPNKAKAFEESTYHLNSNTNLLKKSTTDAGSITNITYEFDQEGNVSKMIMVSDKNEETWNKYIWSCK